MSEHMSSQNPLLLHILMGEDKSTERKVDTTRFHNVYFGKNRVFCLQAAPAEVSKQKQF